MVNPTSKKILIQLMKKFLSSGKFKSNHVKGTLSTYPIEEIFYRDFLYTPKNCMGGWACSTSIKCLFRNTLVSTSFKTISHFEEIAISSPVLTISYGFPWLLALAVLSVSKTDVSLLMRRSWSLLDMGSSTYIKGRVYRCEVLILFNVNPLLCCS